MSGTYKLGYCNLCRRNVHHFRGTKTWSAMIFDASTLFVLNFGPWYCARCEKKTRVLPWFRRREPTLRQIDDGSEQIGNFIRSDGSLVLRKKRSSRYSQKFREGVVFRLLSGKTNIAQLTTDLSVTESDLMAWVQEVLHSRDERIEQLTKLLKAYHQAAGDLIAISDESLRFDEEENMIEGHFEKQKNNSSVNGD